MNKLYNIYGINDINDFAFTDDIYFALNKKNKVSE